MYYWVNYFLTFWHNIKDIDIVFSLNYFMSMQKNKAYKNHWIMTMPNYFCANFILENKNIIIYHFSALAQVLEVLLHGVQWPVCLFIQYHFCWWPGDTGYQSIDSHGIAHNFFPEYRFWAQSLNQSPSPRMYNTIIALRNQIKFQRNKTKFYQIVSQIFRLCKIDYFFKLRVVWPFIRCFIKREISQAIS